VRWTAKQLAEHDARRGIKRPPAAPASKTPGHARLALGRLPTGTMNKTEAAYDARLRELTHAGEVLWHKFEGIKLRLADNTFYTCDFAVLPRSGILELHEVKGGFWTDDARVKIKVAAALYPFKFIAVKVRAKKRGGGWETEEF
jgi:hypothetical protein